MRDLSPSNEQWGFRVWHLTQCVPSLPREVSGKERFALMMLLAAMQDGNYYVSTPEEVLTYHFSRRTARKYLSLLEEKGFISIKKVDRNNNEYSVNMELLESFYKNLTHDEFIT